MYFLNELVSFSAKCIWYIMCPLTSSTVYNLKYGLFRRIYLYILNMFMCTIPWVLFKIFVQIIYIAWKHPIYNWWNISLATRIQTTYKYIFYTFKINLFFFLWRNLLYIPADFVLVIFIRDYSYLSPERFDRYVTWCWFENRYSKQGSAGINTITPAWVETIVWG